MVAASDLLLLPGYIALPYIPDLSLLLFQPVIGAVSVLRSLFFDRFSRAIFNWRNSHLKKLAAERNFRVLVVGGGFSGINVGVELKNLGIPFTIIEKNEHVGGTWYDNIYPGIACDVAAHLYSFSFAQNPNWSKVFVPGQELQKYLEDVVDKFGIRENFHFGTKMTGAVWNKEKSEWEVNTTRGKYTANAIFSCVGALNEPVIPEFPGLSSFKGVAMHSARWRADFDATDKDIIVIGSAASAVQLVPCLAEKAKKVTVFQRTPNYVFPRNNRSYSAVTKWIFRFVPGAMMWYRLYTYLRMEMSYFLIFRNAKSFYSQLSHRAFSFLMRRQFGEEKGKQFVPEYSVGCKRVLIHDEWFPALQRENVETVFSGVKNIVSDGVVASVDGKKHHADVIVFATGFNPISLWELKYEGTEPKGKSAVAVEDISALNGITVAHRPNFFAMLGPNTGLGHNSVVWMVECQVNYALQCIKTMLESRLAAVEPKEEEVVKFQNWIDTQHKSRVWSSGCKSWYQTDKGHVYTLWPGPTFAYWWLVRKFDFSQYLVTPLAK